VEVAASTDNVNGASQLTVWRNKLQVVKFSVRQLIIDSQIGRQSPFLNRNEKSTVGIALLCLGFCVTFQVVVSNSVASRL
jgi:hypothetical protein